MASINEIVFNISNIFRGGYLSSSEPVSERQIAFQVGYYRAILLKRDIENRKTISRKYIQDLGCLPLIKVDKAECCDTEWGCDILRTEQQIPSMIQQSFVGLVDKSTQIPFTTSIQATWAKNNRYTGNLRKAFWRNNYIYITGGEQTLKFINVQGIFHDPLSAADLIDCDGKPCFTWDSEYPLPEEQIPVITEMIMSKEGRLIFQTKNDQTNDSPKEITQG